MTDRDSLPKYQSLRRKLLYPLLVACILFAVLIVVTIQYVFERQLQDRLEIQAEQIAHAVNYSAESISRVGELRRIVNALGGEKEVIAIVVVGGVPERVLASTKNIWLGKTLEELPPEQLRDEIQKVKETQEALQYSDKARKIFGYVVPMLSSHSIDDESQASIKDGAILVQLDTRSMDAQIRKVIMGLSGSMVTGILVFGLIFYRLLKREVVDPLGILSQALQRSGETEELKLNMVERRDEIGAVVVELKQARLRSSHALRRLEDQKFALDQHNIVSVTDAQGRITYSNEKLTAISGYSSTELLGKDHRILNSDTHSKAFFVELWSTIKDGKVWKGKICNRAKDGSLYWVDSTIVPVEDPKGEIEAFIAIRTDITEHILVESELRKATVKAEAANQSKSEFLATMSHEIRTPMNGVLGFASLLQDTPLNEEQSQYVETIQRSGDTLLALIDEILDFSKIEAGKIELESVMFDLSSVVDATVELLAPKAKDKGIRLEVNEFSSVPSRIIGDATRTQQVLTNLVGNGIKFTKTGSVSIAVTAEGSRALKVSVVDTGIGIPEDKVGLLFQKFTQADSSTTRRFGGTGLGLSISKRLVELMGGEIGVKTILGKGTTFWFTIPIAGGSGASVSENKRNSLIDRDAEREVFAGRRQLQGKRILVAEDEKVNQSLMLKLLDSFGCETTLARNGSEVISLHSSQEHDLILMDCYMPEMDGFAATEAIRRSEQSTNQKASQRTPIIAITASVMEEDRERCTLVGMDDFICKPIHRSDLRAALIKWLDL